MSAMTLGPRRASSPLAPLRTVLAAGGWANGLVVLGVLLAPALAAIDFGHSFAAGLTIAAVLTMFWAMLAGARLVGLFAAASRLQVPGVRRQAVACGVAAAVMCVLLPAQAIALGASGSPALATAALAFGLALGLFWVSMPPWLMWPLIGLGVVTRWLPPLLEDIGTDALVRPQVIGLGAALLLAVCAVCWAWIARWQAWPSAWNMPLAIAVSGGNAQATVQGQALLTPDTPLGQDLRHWPRRALGVALGPGFGRNTPRNVLVAQAPTVAVAAFWMLLGATPDKPHIGLTFAPFMVLSAGMAPLVRLQSLFWRPAQGLHELALLPGLPARPAAALPAQVAVQLLVRAVPALAVMLAFGVLVNAPPAFYPMLAWTSAGSLALLSGSALLLLHSSRARWAGVVLGALVGVALLASATFIMPRGQGPWLHAAWALAVVAGAALHVMALRRLRRLPHPWLAR